MCMLISGGNTNVCPRFAFRTATTEMYFYYLVCTETLLIWLFQMGTVCVQITGLLP